MIDTDNSGTITFDELKEGLKRVGSELMESEIKDLMEAVRTILVISFRFQFCPFKLNREQVSCVFHRLISTTVVQLTMVNFLLPLCT